MSIPTDHPFQPGVRVAIRGGEGLRNTYRDAVVEKVYATGHFTLKGDPKQRWRPWQSGGWGGGPPRWEACRTGSHWNRRTVIFRDEETEKEIAEGVTLQKRRDRYQLVRSRFAAISPDTISDALLDALEAALDAAGKAEGKSE